MNLGEMTDELGMIVQDNGKLRTLLTPWINNAILEVANDYDLPPLALVDPVPLEVDTSKWLWPLPDNFHKRLFMCKHQHRSGNYRDHRVHIYKEIRRLEGRDHNFVGERVREVAVAMQGGSPKGDNYYLGIHPLAAETLDLWFFQKPAILKQSGDISDCIPPGFERRVIFPKVIIQNYNYIVDQTQNFDLRPIQYWQTELRKGINGAPGEGIGLLAFYNINYNPPRIVGNMNSIGYRPYYYGLF